MAVAVAGLALALLAAGCGGGGDDGSDDAAASDTTATTAPAATGDGLQVLATNAAGLASPTLDALVQGTYVLPGVALTVAAPAPVDPAAPPASAEAAPTTTFGATAGAYPGVAIQADPANAVTAALSGGIEGVPEGIDLVLVGLNDGALLGPLAGFDPDVGMAQAAAAAGVPVLVVAAGLDESPPDRAAVCSR